MRAGGVLAMAMLLAGMLASCARAPVVGELDLGTRRQRFEAALATRAQAVGCEAELLAWARVAGWRDLPGLQARVLVGAPDAVRIRVGSWFDTAVDLVARGDSVTALLPGRRLAFETAHARDSLGIVGPGGLGYRILSGVWTPPDQAWDQAARADSLVVLAWKAEDEALRMAVGTSGLPVWIERRSVADTVIIAYSAWRTWEGVRWPSRMEVRSESGSFGVQCRLERVRFRDVGREQLTVPIPDGTESFRPGELRQALERMAGS